MLGRFVAGPATKRQLHELDRETLAELIVELRANTKGLVARLDATFARPDLRPIDLRDLDRQIDRHGLRELFIREERENLRVLLRRNRGFEAPIRRILGLSASQLRRRIERYGLEEEIRALKERTREEARAEAPLVDRLQLATSRTDVLRDAGVLDELDARNRPELEEALSELEAQAGGDPRALLELSRRRLGLDPPLWRKVVAHYRLEDEAAALLGVTPVGPEGAGAGADRGGTEAAPRGDRRGGRGGGPRRPA